MSENIFKEQIPSSSTDFIKETVLGDRDPSLMGKEEFEKSPDLLFHGCSKPIEFNQNFDYYSNGYLTNNDGSTTLGVGFYTVDNRSAAESYSKQRQSRVENPHENILSILPYKARMLDFRQENNLDKNIPVPKEFALKWKEYFNDYLKKRPQREGNVGKIFDKFESDYSNYLDKVLELDSYSLRVLLMTESSKELKSGSAPSPLWSTLFKDFVINQGYDGVIYNEKVEGSDITSPSYVFYNLQKIGTYESWHKISNNS